MNSVFILLKKKNGLQKCLKHKCKLYSEKTERHDYFKYSFFPSAMTEWNKLDLKIRKSASLNTFKMKRLNVIQPCANSIFDIHNPLGIHGHLHEHNFRHCFQDTLNLLCKCGKDIESRMHFFLHCITFPISRQTLFQKIKNIDDRILSQSKT